MEEIASWLSAWTAALCLHLRRWMLSPLVPTKTRLQIWHVVGVEWGFGVVIAGILHFEFEHLVFLIARIVLGIKLLLIHSVFSWNWKRCFFLGCFFLEKKMFLPGNRQRLLLPGINFSWNFEYFYWSKPINNQFRL